ncbi:DUF3466 family protein [Argonema antarcticum]|uniref:DUF3466 family protein n=1 Tax=Argonema antarcticum TaxID=2942763 RepID=UPI002012D6F2|nr:DUF3466 family protein [Argonema antarcticum]MCL1473358.1 DUF3466 family protein [Argonema antarcticum A004/B2]
MPTSTLVKKLKKLSFSLTTITALGLATSQSAEAASFYSISDLGTLGGTESMAYGINNLGQVVGQSQTASGAKRAFLWTDGVGMSDLGHFGSNGSYATSINDSGQVSGTSGLFPDSRGEARAFRYTDGVGKVNLGVLPPNGGDSRGNDINASGQVVGWANRGHGFGYPESNDNPGYAVRWTGSSIQSLGTLGGYYSVGTGINDNGQVTGYSATARNAATHAFLWTEGVGMTDLGTLGGKNSYASKINNSGQVVGKSQTANGDERAFLWNESDGMTDLGTLGGKNSYAWGINKFGLVVGNSDDANESSRAFLWENDVMTDLNSLIATDSGWELKQARDINDLGQIVGWGSINGKTHAFLLTPVSEHKSVPEPSSTLGLLAFGTFGVASLLKRKQQEKVLN